MNVLASRFVGVPSLVAPELRERFEAALAAVMAHERSAELLSPQAAADDGFWFAADDWRAQFRPYVVRDGVLQIPVKGVLLHDFPFAFGSWATGYIYIARALDRGLADPEVRGIALLVDSYGGEVAGNFELVDRIFAARGQKPIRAFAHEYAYSAGYSIASAADAITVSRTGGVGSIGVVTAHLDMSAALDDAGLKITFVFAGAHKVDGNPYEPLPEAVKSRIQGRIDSLYAIFTGTVARNRGLTDAAVRATEALTYTADEAVKNGLADSIGPLDDAVAAFAADLASPEDEGDDTMSDNTRAAADAASAEQANKISAAKAEGHAEGVAAGTKTERARVSAILGADEAKGRDELAKHLAFDTDMSADGAKAILAKSPTAAAAAPVNALEAAMKAAGNPSVGPNAPAGGGADGADESPEALAAQAMALFSGNTGAQASKAA